MASWIPGSQDYNPNQDKAPSKPKSKGGGLLGKLGNAVGDVGGFVEDQAAGVGHAAADTLGTGLKILNAPGNAVRSAYSEEAQSLHKDGFNPLKAAGAWFSGAGKGLIGKENTSFAKLVGAVQTGKPVEKKLPWGVETLGEVATDPVSYLTVGTSKAAEEGLAQLAKSAGSDAAKSVVKSGLTAQGENALRKALIDAGKKPDQIEHIVKAVRKGGQGGLKFMGHSIPGATSESALGQSASAASDLAKQKIASLPGADTARAIFRRGANLAASAGVGKDAAQQAVQAIDAAGHAANANNTVLQRGLENVLKDYGPVSEADRTTILDALEGGAKKAAETPAPYTGIPSEMDNLMRTIKQSTAEAAGQSAVPYTQQVIQRLHNSGQSKLADLIDQLDQVRHATTEAQKAQGLLPLEHVTSEYVPHLLTPEGEAFRQANPDTVYQVLGNANTPASDLERILSQKGMTQARTLSGTIDSINQQMKAAGFTGEKFLEDNPVALTALRSKVANNAIERAKMLDNLTKITGEDGKPLLQQVGKEGRADLELPEIGRRYAGKPEVIKLLNDSHALATDPTEIHTVWKATQGLQKLWKQYAIASPAFHARKTIGDLWMSTLAGVRNPVEYEHGFSMANSIRKALDVVQPGQSIEDALKEAAPKLSDQEREDIAYFFNHGGTANFVNTEVKGAGESTLAKQSNKVASALKKGVKANQNATSFISDGFRASVYLHTLEETGNRDAAMKAVNKFLFDYNDLTKSEKSIRSNVIPFYTFMRKNVPLQFEQMLKQPGLFNAYGAAQNELNQRGVDYRPMDPVREAQEITQPKAQSVTNAMSPFIKAPVEFGLGVNDFGNKVPTVHDRLIELLHQFGPPLQKVDSFQKKPILQTVLGFKKLGKKNAPAQNTGAPSTSSSWIPKH